MTTVAIDGPGGAGKSTLARRVAAELGLDYLDTGAMYRAVTLRAMRDGIELANGPAVAGLAKAIDLVVGERVILDGEDVTAAIRTPEVTKAVSVVAARPEVRAELVARQRAWVEARGGGVLEGRDIGTVVCPDADLKIYLTAREDERARRRAGAPPDEGGGTSVTEALQIINRRDLLDQGRAVSPLVVAEDAIVIDSTSSSSDEVLDLVLSLIKGALA